VAGALRQVPEDAASTWMLADVAVGRVLSGGLDSAIIAAD
jgi:asparagine synthetase B (glutamine-hydrolysing)